MCNKHTKHFLCRGCNRPIGTCYVPELCAKNCVNTPLGYQTKSHEHLKSHFSCMKCKKEGSGKEERAVKFRKALEELAALEKSNASKSTASKTSTESSKGGASTITVASSKGSTVSAGVPAQTCGVISKELVFKSGKRMVIVQQFWKGIEEYCLTDPTVDYIKYQLYRVDGAVFTERQSFNVK